MIHSRVTLVSSFALSLLLLACSGQPQVKPLEPSPQPPEPIEVAPVEPASPPPSPPLEPEVQPPPPPVPLPVFDPATVTAAQKEEAIIDIRGFIESLNTIVQKKDYEAWKSNLTEEFINYYGSAAFLQQISENPRFKGMNIKLNTLKDYFVFVVYPSHQHDRIDDIEFIGEHMVKAFTKGNKGELYVLYSLEKQNGIWKIGIGR